MNSETNKNEHCAQDAPKVESVAVLTLRELERRHIEFVLGRSNSIYEAAKTLGIDNSTLWRKRKIYNLD